jgi:metal-sulfur cluster biosynthetic enzyme
VSGDDSLRGLASPGAIAHGAVLPDEATLRLRVVEALGTVYDPELDEPITTLGFVGSCVVSGDGDVAVRLRLPTPQCAPNFAFLMAADARAAIDRVPGLRQVEIELQDHYTGEEINTAISRGDGFSDAFPGETRGELDALRALFQRKALVAREGRLLPGVQDPAAATLGQLTGADAVRCRELRRELGIDARDDAPAFVKGDGTPVAADEFPRFTRMASLTALSLETNGGMCRDLLRIRYSEEGVAA